MQCEKCKAFLARNVVLAQLGKGKKSTFCHECGKKLKLPDPEPVSRLTAKEEVIIDAQQAVAHRRTAFEAALVRVKALLREAGHYLCDVSETGVCSIASRGFIAIKKICQAASGGDK